IYPQGGDYLAPQTLVITDATSGVSIYYTTDGSTPTILSTLYSGPAPLTQTGTINAIAVANGLSSAMSTASYNINLTTAGVNYGLDAFTAKGLSLNGATVTSS